MSLPAGWVTITIADLGGTVGGKTPSKAKNDYWLDGTVPWVSPKDMKVFEIYGSEDRITQGAVAEAGMHLIPIGSVLLVTRSGILAHTLPVATTKVVVTINQDIKAIRPVESAYCSRFLAYGLRALESRILNECTKSGTTVASVELPLLEQLELPFAPRTEQQRIADKLDTVLARVDACRDRLVRVAPLLKRFRQSVLAAAFSGRMGEDPTSVETYPTQPLAMLAKMRLGKMLDKQKNTGTAVPYLGNINVRWFGFQLEDLKLISIEEREREEFSIRDGDVLICEGGEPGRCAVWMAGPTDIVYQKALHRVRPEAGKLLPMWLALYMKHCCDAHLIDDLFTGSTIKHLTGVALAKLLVPLPSLATQARVIRRVETLFAFADRLDARLAQAQTAVDRLTPSLLAKAFRGELVQQDPADEPAAELLKRLATTAADRSPQGRGRRRATAAA